jgi:hypothetical protein
MAVDAGADEQRHSDHWCDPERERDITMPGMSSVGGHAPRRSSP